MNARIGDVIKDPIKLSMLRNDSSAVANNAKAGAAQEVVTQKGSEGQGEKAVNKALQMAANPTDSVFTNPLFNATAGRTTTHKSGEQRRYSANEKIAKGQDLSQLLSKGDSAAPPTDKTRVERDDKYLPQRFKNERDGALLSFTSGAVTTPKTAKTKDLEDKTHPLVADKPEQEEGFVAYTIGSVKKAAHKVGEKLAFFG